MNIKCKSYNNVLLQFWGNFFPNCRYFRDLIGGQKINVTFGGAVTFGILLYNYCSRSPAVTEY